MTFTFTVAASEHRIKSVTVFKSSKAEIVRTFSLHLKKGQNKVEIRGLSSSIDTHSVRVSGLGTARLFDVVCTLDKNANDTTHASDSPSELVRTLAVKRLALESEKVIREQESHLLLKYAETLSGEHVTPGQMSQFLENYVSQGRKIVEAIVAIDEQIIAIDRLSRQEKKKTTLKKGSTNGAVDIVVFADEEDIVDLKLTYIVNNAQWKPTYELHASTENGKPSPSVNLHYRARVTQETGEDWNNTSLTLNTIMSDTMVTSIPQLKQRKIRPKARGLFGQFGITNGTLFGQPVSLPRQHVPGQVTTYGSAAPTSASFFGLGGFGGGGGRGGYGSGRGAAFGSSSAAADPEIAEFPKAEGVHVPEDDSLDDFEEVENSSPITENKTMVSETPIAVSFSVQGESTIPSDGIEHQVSVAELTSAAKISYITIPRADARVFLQCKVTNSSEYRLLPGPVRVIYDDSYVSETSISKEISTGDTFECTLGDDAGTKVTYERSSKTVKSDGGAFTELTNTTTYNTKITIQNKHQFAIADLIIRDSVPTCDDKRAKVILRKPDGLAEAKDGESVDLKNQGLRAQWEPLVDGKGGYKEGKFEWKWNVNIGAKAVVEAEWDVKSTGDTEWIEGF